MERAGRVEEYIATGNAAVVDTCVASFLFKRSPLREAYEPHLIERLPVLSFMSVAELELWAVSQRWGDKRRSGLEQELRKYVVYPVTRTLCRVWAEVTDSARRKGYTILSADAWIAAAASYPEPQPTLCRRRRQWWFESA